MSRNSTPTRTPAETDFTRGSRAYGGMVSPLSLTLSPTRRTSSLAGVKQREQDVGQEEVGDQGGHRADDDGARGPHADAAAAAGGVVALEAADERDQEAEE